MNKWNASEIAAEVRSNIKDAQKQGKLVDLKIRIRTTGNKDQQTISVQIIDGPNPENNMSAATTAINEVRNYISPIIAWQNGWSKYASLSIVNTK